jgi:hypothetical protein
MSSPSSGSKLILIDMRDRQYELLADTADDAESWIKELVAIRDAELMKNLLEKSLRQSWTFTPSGKAIRIDAMDALLLQRERDRECDRMSMASLTLDNDREESACTQEEIVLEKGQAKFKDRNTASDCCSCIPLIF